MKQKDVLTKNKDLLYVMFRGVGPPNMSLGQRSTMIQSGH